MTNLRHEGKVDQGVSEDHVMELAETTEVSPQQARELLQEHNGDLELARREAKNFKAES